MNEFVSKGHKQLKGGFALTLYLQIHDISEFLQIKRHSLKPADFKVKSLAMALFFVSPWDYEVRVDPHSCRHSMCC